jgi:hypothetical protein
LSIVAALAAAHGGRAFVHSALGEGTVFTVELPASDVPEATEAGIRPSAVGPPRALSDPAEELPTGADPVEASGHVQRPVRH